MDKVQHFEIPSKNLDKAKMFYGDIFGWEARDMDEGDMEYTMVWTGKTDRKGMIKEKGVINGGIIKKMKHIKSPLIYITVDSIDNTAKNIKNHGGKVLMDKMPVGDMGYLTHFEDLDGNVLGLWESMKK